MKNILVPTDFSACADNAAKVAFSLAQYYGATFHLFSNLAIEKQWTKTLDEQENYSDEDLQKIHNTELLFKDWADKAKAHNVGIKTYWTAGNLLENIKEAIPSFDIDFIVMGSHGASGKNEYFVGTNTQKVVRMVHCPVLIVKEDIRDYKIKKVIFASNFDPKEKEAFQYLLDFIQPHQPEIHLLEVKTGGWFSQPHVLVKELMNDFKDMCGNRPVKMHFLRNWTVDAGVRKFADEIGADLISISNHQRHPMKRMVSGSNVEALVNHSKVPVLSIDFEK